MMSAQKVYRQIINEDDGGPRHVINTPRDHNQVKNFQKENNRQFRISHDALYNAYQLYAFKSIFIFVHYDRVVKLND